MNTPEALKGYCLKKLDERGWSQREWSIRASLAPNAISLLLNDHLPEERSIRALARAANVSEDYMLYLAGYIERDPMQGRNPEIEGIAERLEELPDKKLRAALPIILATIEQIENL